MQALRVQVVDTWGGSLVVKYGHGACKAACNALDAQVAAECLKLVSGIERLRNLKAAGRIRKWMTFAKVYWSDRQFFPPSRQPYGSPELSSAMELLLDEPLDRLRRELEQRAGAASPRWRGRERVDEIAFRKYLIGASRKDESLAEALTIRTGYKLAASFEHAELPPAASDTEAWKKLEARWADLKK
jgi:hypothetical protein